MRQVMDGSFHRGVYDMHAQTPGTTCRSYVGRFFGTVLSTSYAPTATSRLHQDMYCCAMCVRTEACEMWMLHQQECILMSDSVSHFNSSQLEYRGNWRNKAPPVGCGTEAGNNMGSACYDEKAVIDQEDISQVTCPAFQAMLRLCHRSFL